MNEDKIISDLRRLGINNLSYSSQQEAFKIYMREMRKPVPLRQTLYLLVMWLLRKEVAEPPQCQNCKYRV